MNKHKALEHTKIHNDYEIKIPTITFVNHASIIISYDNINLITDPWLFGSAFNNGWVLICKTKMTLNEFNNITHIWLSHEHFDHFSASVLKSIPEETRKKITFLFHETRDKKVVNFCKSLGFSIIEMKPNRRYELAKRFHVTCGLRGLIDSWLFAEVGTKKILNLNDCDFNTKLKARLITRHPSQVDVLLTQFSYARWVGNPEEVNYRKSFARKILDGIKTQADFFNPSFIIPFASQVRFVHVDNSYLNKDMNKFDDANQFIENRTNAKSIILYPGDTWTVGDKHENLHAISRYKKDYDFQDETLSNTPIVSMNELKGFAFAHTDRIRKRNSWFFIRLFYLIGFFKTAKIFVKDLNSSISFDTIHGIRSVAFDKSEADIILDSDSLADVLKYDWGISTLSINGRYRTSGGNVKNFFKLFFISVFNSCGFNFPFGIIKWHIKETWSVRKNIF